MNPGTTTAATIAPATTAAAGTTGAVTTPITQAIRDFYSNIAGTPTSSQAEGDVTAFNKLTPATADILKSFDTQYGVDAASSRVQNLRKSVMNAEDLVNNVEDNVFSRTSNALVSDAQRARLTAAEKDPLTKQLDVINRDYTTASGDLTSAREQSDRFSGAEIGDISTMRGSLADRLTTTQQREAAAAAQAKADEENRQWWTNYQEQVRQFNSQMDLSNRSLTAQIDASKKSTNDLLASIRGTSAQPAAASSPSISSPAYNSSGQLLGYETPTQSVQTAAGMAQTNHDLTVARRGTLQNILGGVGDLTGWF